MKYYEIKAYWINEGESPGPYWSSLGKLYSTDELITKKAHEWFDIWRQKNPESDGWRSMSWFGYEEAKDG